MLAHRADTRIWQSLDISARPTKGQLEAKLTLAHAHNRAFQATSVDRAHDFMLDICEKLISQIEVDLTVRWIEDVEVELIALACQIETEKRQSEHHRPNVLARLSLYLSDREHELTIAHAKLGRQLLSLKNYRD